MHILDAGHSYLLTSYDGGMPQQLDFMKRVGATYPFNHSVHAGTNCQEVLRALIDRTRYLLTQAPCAETEAALGLLQTTLLLFELRAARRHARTLDIGTLMQLGSMSTCATCGHAECHDSTHRKEE